MTRPLPSRLATTPAAVRAHLDGSSARALSEARDRAHAAEVAADGLAAELADARARIAELETNREAWPVAVGDRTLLGAILARLVLDPAADAGRGVWRLAVPAAVREAWMARHSSAGPDAGGVEPLRRCEPSDEAIPARVLDSMNRDPETGRVA